MPQFKIDQADLELKFGAQSKPNTLDKKNSIAENVVKMAGPVKKRFFAPEESKTI